jgi:hypothetical protein
MGLDQPDRPFEFVILGNTPLEPHLVRYYRQVRIAGHRVFLRRAEDLADVGQPHLLFIARLAGGRPRAIVGTLKSARCSPWATARASRSAAWPSTSTWPTIRSASRSPGGPCSVHQLEASYHLLTWPGCG